jgi:hypothetical protein
MEVKPSEISLWECEISGEGKHGTARSHLVYVVAEAYGAKSCVVTADRRRRNSVHIVGTEDDLAALRILIPSILVQAERTGLRARSEYRLSLTGGTPAQRTGAAQRFFRSYLIAYGMSVAKKIATARKSVVDAVVDESTALELVKDKERILSHFGQLYPDLSTNAVRSTSSAGAQAGHRDGQLSDTHDHGYVQGGRLAITG